MKLSDDEVEDFKEMVLHSGWKIFTKVLDGFIADALENVSRGTKDTFDEKKGLLEGLRKVKQIKEHIIRNVG